MRLVRKRFTYDEENFYVDLVFYNRLLRCYVLIDLKIDKLTHQDLGQMQMYVNYYDRYQNFRMRIRPSEYSLYLPDKKLLQKSYKSGSKKREAKTNEAAIQAYNKRMVKKTAVRCQHDASKQRRRFLVFSLRFAQLDFVPKNLYIVQWPSRFLSSLVSSCIRQVKRIFLINAVLVFLNFLPHLKDIKLQIIGLVRRPENGVVAALGAEIDLAETFVGAVGRFPDGFGEKLRIHEMGAGAGDKKAVVLHQLQTAQIDLRVALHRVFDGIAGFG